MAPACGVIVGGFGSRHHVACSDGAEVAEKVNHLDRSSLRPECQSLIGTALQGAIRRVVWNRGANYSPGPDSVLGVLSIRDWIA
jgi:hypothetical protein